MPEKTIEVDFMIGDNVIIRDTDFDGRVIGIWIDQTQTIQYQVRYFAGGKLDDRWFISSNLHR